MIIYKTTNLINNKFYVGKDTLNKKSYLGSGKIIKKAIKKYGKENFKKEILEECKDNEETCKREIYWIAKLKPHYNITKGGDGGDTISEHPNKKNIIKRQKLTKKERGIGIGEKNPSFGRIVSLKEKKKKSYKMKELYKNGKIKKKRMTKEGKLSLSKRMKENPPTRRPDVRLKNHFNNLGNKNPNAYMYEFKNPDGNIYIVSGGIKDFCKLYDLSYKKVIKLHKGIINNLFGWKCKKLGKIKDLG